MPLMVDTCSWRSKTSDLRETDKSRRSKTSLFRDPKALQRSGMMHPRRSVMSVRTAAAAVLIVVRMPFICASSIRFWLTVAVMCLPTY